MTNWLTDRPINWPTDFRLRDGRTDKPAEWGIDRSTYRRVDFNDFGLLPSMLLITYTGNISFWLDSFTWWNVHTCVILTFGSLFMNDKTPSLAPWSLMAFSNALLLLSKHPLDPLQVMLNVCVAFSLNSRRKFSCVFPTPVYEIWKTSKCISFSLTDFPNRMILDFFHHVLIKKNKHEQRKRLHLITIFVFAEPFRSRELLPLFVRSLFNANRKTKHLIHMAMGIYDKEKTEDTTR